MQSINSEYKIVAVVLHYNSSDTLFKVLDGIRRQTISVKNIIIIDNASSIDLSSHFKDQNDISFTRLAVNQGVGAGHNVGWKMAIDQYHADFIWSLEHDAIPKSDCLEKLLAHYKASEVMAICPVEDNGLDFGKNNYYIFHSSGFRKLTDKRKNTLYKGGLSFNGLLLPVNIISRVGYLNESFFIGREDMDFYKRIYKSGGYVLRVPDSQVYHNLYKEQKQIRFFHTVFLFPQQSILREYYSYRNSVYMLSSQGTALWKLYFRHVIGIFLTLLFRNSKVQRIRNRTVAFRNGMQGILGKMN